ncbi:hypothetical protein FRC03_003900 [Tulasnella sp. 419]|nr:hypothetical protein FRC03_003900 [Tulasnella sp. 419]
MSSNLTLRAGIPERYKRRRDPEPVAESTPQQLISAENEVEDLQRRPNPPGSRNIFTVPNDHAREGPLLTIFGENDVYYGSANSRRVLPKRTLSDFTIFNPRDGNSIISLELFNSNAPGNGYAFEAAGLVNAYTGDIEVDDIDLPLQRVHLTHIKDIRVEYDTDAILDVWVSTEYAEYRLEIPSTFYNFHYVSFWKKRRYVHLATIYSRSEPNIAYESFVEQVTHDRDLTLDRAILGQRWKLNDMNGLVGNVYNEVRECAATMPDQERSQWLNLPLISHILDGDVERLLQEGLSRMSLSQSPSSAVSYRGRPKPSIAQPIHMMPITGKLAERMFNARFTVEEANSDSEESDGSSSHLDEQQKARKRAEVEKLLTTEFSKNWVSCDGPDDLSEIMITDRGKKTRYRVGDFALIARPEYDPKDPQHRGYTDSASISVNEIANEFGFVQITGFVLKESGWDFHCRTLYHSSKTILQEVGHSRELFMSTLCQFLKVGVLVEPLNVKVVRPDEEWVEPPDKEEDSLDFFLRYTFTEGGAFGPLDKHVFAARPQRPFACICIDLMAQHKSNIPVLYLPKRTTPSISSNKPGILTFKNQLYRVNDYVFINPEEPGVYRVGQIVNLDQQFITVRMIGREEDLARKWNSRATIRGRFDDSKAVYKELNSHMLYLTGTQLEFETKNLGPLCHVRHVSELMTNDDINEWKEYGGFIIGKELDQEHDSEDSLKDLSFFDFTPCSPECRKTEDEELLKIREFCDPENTQRNRRCFDLFCGAGGFTSGFARMGWNVEWGLDIDADAAGTMKQRHPSATIYIEDSRKLLHRLLSDDQSKYPLPGDIDLLLIGPPCQDFSGLNRFKAKDDSRKAMVANALTCVEYWRPDYVIIENVVPLMHAKLQPFQQVVGRDGVTKLKRVEIKHGVHKFILRSFTALGYNVHWIVYSAAHFGTPQERDRLFYVASKRGLPLPTPMLPTHARTPLRPKQWDIPFLLGETSPVVHGAPYYPFNVYDAISDLPPFDWTPPPPGFRLCKETPAQKERREQRLRDGIPAYTPDVTMYEDVMIAQGFSPRYCHAPRNDYHRLMRQPQLEHGYESDPDPEEHLISVPRQHITRYFSSLNVERVINIGFGKTADHRELPRRLELPGLNNADSVGARNHNFFAGLYGRVQYDSFFQTVVTELKPSNKQGRCLHPEQMRLLSVRECARAQGFPDDVVFCAVDDDPISMHRQIGNAVPMPLSLALAKHLVRLLALS